MRVAFAQACGIKVRASRWFPILKRQSLNKDIFADHGKNARFFRYAITGELLYTIKKRHFEFINSSEEIPDCFNIARNVPSGISPV